MKKIYKVKLNNKVYEVELQEVTTVEGEIITETTTAKTVVEKPAAPVSSSGATVQAPMPGVIVDIKVKVGDNVKKGDLVAIIEAMKMETELLSTADGVVSAINVTKGSQVDMGDAIITL